MTAKLQHVCFIATLIEHLWASKILLYRGGLVYSGIYYYGAVFSQRYSRQFHGIYSGVSA